MKAEMIPNLHIESSHPLELRIYLQREKDRISIYTVLFKIPECPKAIESHLFLNICIVAIWAGVVGNISPASSTSGTRNQKIHFNVGGCGLNVE